MFPEKNHNACDVECLDGEAILGRNWGEHHAQVVKAEFTEHPGENQKGSSINCLYAPSPRDMERWCLDILLM